MEKKLTLYINAEYTSPYAMSVYVSLIEKGIPFELKKVDLTKKENQQEPYLSFSPAGKVPTLVEGEFALFESSAIEEYLEEAFPPPHHQALYPRDIQARALARQIQAWLRSDLMLLRQERPTTVIFKGPITTPLSEAAQAEAEKLCRVVEAILPLNSTNLFGLWSIADTDLALMLNRLVMNGDHIPARLNEYALVQWERPSVQAWMSLNKNEEVSVYQSR
jgi:glutathione S-transferase